MCLVIIASILAAVGLATDNVVVIVASMLVSPIMGPILAVCFGTFVFDFGLVCQGLVTEGMGLLLCVLTGFLSGLVFGPFAQDQDGLFAWPTSEMSSRGEQAGLWLGVAIAVPSGLGVALSVMGSNTSSLVGVAISASLLPPLVNAGMMWAHALGGKYWIDLDDGGRGFDVWDYVQMGGFSFALTMVNIACILVTGIFMFWFKEAAPYQGKSPLFRSGAEVRRRALGRSEPQGPTPQITAPQEGGRDRGKSAGGASSVAAQQHLGDTIDSQDSGRVEPGSPRSGMGDQHFTNNSLAAVTPGALTATIRHTRDGSSSHTMPYGGGAGAALHSRTNSVPSTAGKSHRRGGTGVYGSAFSAFEGRDWEDSGDGEEAEPITTQLQAGPYGSYSLTYDPRMASGGGAGGSSG